MAERLYFKMWRSWWTGESHVELGADGLAIGPCLMSFVRWEPGVDQGWAVQENGRPVTVGTIARRAKWTPKRVAEALKDLEDKGTISLRPDGAWGFPKFGQWQESADAARKRKDRAKSADSPKIRPPKVPVLVEVEDSSSLRSEPPVVPKPGPNPDPVVDHVLEAMRAACRELGGRGPQDNPANRKLIARITTECRPTLDDWTHVVQAQLASVRGDPSKHRYLALSTLCVPANFLRLLDAPAGKTQAANGQRFDSTPDQLHRERQERMAAIAAEENR